MYDCKVRFYLVACPAWIVDVIKKMPPLPRFTHFFTESGVPDMELAGNADVILAGPDILEKDLASLVAAGKKNAEILLLRCEGSLSDTGILENIHDLWRLPLEEAELKFYFRRWQEKYKREKDLWEKDYFLEAMLATTPNLCWFKTMDGVHELVNDSFCHTVNKSREQVTGRKHAYIWDVEADDPACIESERIVMESGKTHVSEEHVHTGDGNRILTTYKSPLYNLDGSPMGTLGVAVDVTREREYHDRLISNNASLENIFTTMECGVLCHSRDGAHVLSANPAALRLLGMPSMEILESSGFDMVSITVLDEDREKVRSAISSLKNEGDSANYAYRVVHGDGKLLHVMGNAKLVKKDGELVCQRFLLDCTAQKQMEEKERSEQERRQMELVRALSVDYQLVCVFNVESREGTVLQLMDYPDTNLKAIFSGDKSLPDQMEEYIQRCVHPDDRAEFARVIKSLADELTRRKMCYFNYRALIGDNTHYFQLKAVRGWRRGEAFGIVLGLQSIDLQVRQEMEQKNQLIEALKQARKASRTKSVFLSNMSHDIRTPMNAIVGYTSLALDHLGNRTNVEDYLNKILLSGNHLISLINDILDVSYIESGKIHLEEKLCDLRGLVRELWNIVQPTASAKSQTLSLNMDGVRNTLIFCDKLRLNQLLLNLLSNAVKYTADGGAISLNISQLLTTKPNNAIYEFRVKDNGMGMSQEFVQKIFEPFERAQNSTLSGIQGTGLGMTIARNIVDMMKGEIEVSSQLGEGTEFVVRLSFRVAKEEHKLSSQLDGKNTAGMDALNGARDGRCGRLLLAEDNEMNREIACEFLTGAGYTVDVAPNGQKAVEMLCEAGSGYYDLVLMDVQMPVLDGYGATELIRKLPDNRLAAIPIIAMTANSFEEDRQEALRHGMNEHIAKPIDFNILFKILDRMVG